MKILCAFSVGVAMTSFTLQAGEAWVEVPMASSIPSTHPQAVYSEIPAETVVTEEDGPSELECLAVDIARRSVLAHYPKAAARPIRTLQVRSRPQGDVVHLYARLQWSCGLPGFVRSYESEVFASLIHTPDIRRIYDISYRDNRLKPWRVFNRRIDLISRLNKEFERRDPLRMATPLVGNRQDMLVPRSRPWIYHPLQGDHGWHAGAADDYIAPRWAPLEAPIPLR